MGKGLRCLLAPYNVWLTFWWCYLWNILFIVMSGWHSSGVTFGWKRSCVNSGMEAFESSYTGFIFHHFFLSKNKKIKGSIQPSSSNSSNMDSIFALIQEKDSCMLRLSSLLISIQFFSFLLFDHHFLILDFFIFKKYSLRMIFF